MTKIEFHTEAQSELEDAHAWYRERSELAARAFAAEIDYAIRSISRSPDAWPQTRSNEHRFVSEVFHIRLSIAFARMRSLSRRLLIKSDDLAIGVNVN
jgi:plasmid stabilization system protein ParE